MMIELIFEWGINFIETFIVTDFLTKYFGCKYSDKRKTIGFLCSWGVLFVQLCIMNHMTDLESLGSYIPIIINFVYAVFFLKGNILFKLWISTFIQIMILVVAMAINLLICTVISYNPNEMITVFNSTRVIGVVITKIILFYLTRIILRRKYENPIDNHSWLLLIIIPVISIISLSALMFAVVNHEEIKIYILVGMSCIVIANIITYYFFTVLNKDYEKNLRIKLLEQQNENDKKNIKNADAFVRQMKSVRHDMKNQLLIIDNFINSQKYEEARKYISNLTGNYMPDVQNLVSTGNEAFDAIINSKIAICSEKGIFMETKIMSGSLECFNDVDTGILFGNLIDNAIEAAEKTEEKRITVDVQTTGAYLSIIVENSITESVLQKNKTLETSKPDKEMHGIGVKTIKEIVKKYNGMVDFSEKGNEFSCHIMLDIDK